MSYPDGLVEFVVETRGLEDGGRPVYTYPEIALLASDEFGIGVTEGQVTYICKVNRMGGKRADRRVSLGRPMPPAGTHLQCACCGQSVWSPDVPPMCPSLRCPTRLSVGGRLTADCVEFEEVEIE